jgi:hypothetical protein
MRHVIRTVAAVRFALSTRRDLLLETATESPAIDATRVMWEFFKPHPLRGL